MQRRLAPGSDIVPRRVHAQIEVFLWGPKKAEAISIPCAEWLYVGRLDDPTLGMTSKNAWTPGEDTPGPDMYQLYRGRGPDLSPPRRSLHKRGARKASN